MYGYRFGYLENGNVMRNTFMENDTPKFKTFLEKRFKFIVYRKGKR